MELNELSAKLAEAKTSEETYVILHLMGEVIEGMKDGLKETFTQEQPRSMAFPELGKTFSIMEIKKNSLLVKEIKEQMTDEQIRAAYKPTAKDLDFLGLSELKELSEVTIQKQVRVTSLTSS